MAGGDRSAADGAGDTDLPPAVATIYRSVGPANTSPLVTSASGLLAVSGGTATFPVDLPDRVGVGDALQYDSNGDDLVDALAFISGRSSARSYAVAAADGTAAVPVAASGRWSLYRAYTSLADAEAGRENSAIDAGLRDFDAWTGGNDLSAATGIGKRWFIACYGDAPDTTNVRIEGWTTDAAHYLRLYTPVTADEVGVSQRHPGAWSDARYHLAVPVDAAIWAIVDHLRIEGLQLTVLASGATGGNTNYGVTTRGQGPASDVRLSHNLVRGFYETAGTLNSRGFFVADATATSVTRIWNNIIYNLGTSRNAVALSLSNAGVAYAYNNTMDGVNVGIELGTTAIPTIMLAKNNVVFASATIAYRANETSSFDAACSHNAAADGTAPGANAVTLTSAVATDYVVGTADFHLAAAAPLSAALIDAGVSLSGDSSLAFTDDIDGQPRTTAWDLGADEL